MDHVGEDKGGGSPVALRPTPCSQAAMDPGPVPMQGESLPVFQDRVVNRLRRIAKEEQKLAVKKEDLRKKKSLHSKSGNSKREVSKLKSLEEVLKKQEKLVASLKESSGVFREKCENEERSQEMMESACASTSQMVDTRAITTVWIGCKEVASHGGPSTTLVSGSVVSESVSSPLPPQHPGSSQEEVEENGRLLQTITEMESPLSGTDSSDEDLGIAGGDGVYPDREVSAGCEESHMATNSAEQECCINTETAEEEGRMNAETAGVSSKQKTLLDDGTAGNCGTTGNMVSRTVVLEGRRQDQVVGKLPNQISEVPMQPVNIPMQPVNVSSVPVRNYTKAVLGQSHAASGREPVV
ncbi:hypothetical protein AB205_0206280 [Aquarana catesbeiana]|uniref:Uncharacterized protein n=1 Tax=Aquarana catesbeiana TaxID=8400 RepID=A0A2G9Q9L2_AQUCT|nr:hypothetical protein AB205_0206280 [Aquarana catesbeiana]